MVEVRLVPDVVEDLHALPGPAVRSTMTAIRQLAAEPWIGRPLSFRSADVTRTLHVLRVHPSGGLRDSDYLIAYELLPSEQAPSSVLVLAVLGRRGNALETVRDLALARPSTSHRPYDVFLSYTYADSEVATALVQALRTRSLKVWFDRNDLAVGDSLRKKIDDGLAQSRYGVVILSPTFFQMSWPRLELQGLAERELNGERVILPIWHGVSLDEVLRYAPPLADKVAMRSADETIEQMADKIAAIAG